ncbi:MAG TPA: hypothetical protein VH370_03415 [Humisphaera sp.]|jgi:hypothetical protein|nr:hypothetical protein [Humisphaera sp.]
MPDETSPSANQRLLELCRSVRVSPEADPEIHRELLGHLRDKLRGYMSGADKPSEEDALLLVERHFGDFALIQDGLQRIHAPRRSWLRRLAAVTVASALCPLPWMLFCTFFSSPEQVRDDVRNYNADAFHFAVLSFLVCWALLARWNRNAASGRAPWFMRWTPSSLGWITALALAPYLARFSAMAAPPYTGHLPIKLLELTIHNGGWATDGTFGSYWGRLYGFWQAAHAYGTEPLICIAEGLLWIWWLNQNPATIAARLRGIALAAVAWTASSIFRGGIEDGLYLFPPFLYVLLAWVLAPVSAPTREPTTSSQVTVGGAS